ncbi:Carnitine monooxygenase reductase subunit [Paraburkholderia caffeinitolerans]|uniref:Carnitine monooxygenase reductase subunit n=1 Tax=Paraburkholderia caffeinitolerans TaxID=1723730 RepID=A0A6J5FNZ1_9BURK|nr:MULTISPECIES: PDR/VanB family oxidoreductase [Paraburkholderia]CAB3781599.1 Carnitine monooxygenase reductase subunit [Paraburkholderia caffeinitolerans]
MSTAPVTDAFDVVVETIEPLTSHVTAFRLRAPDGRALPGFTAGAHIRVQVGGGDWRAYSLINLASEACTASEHAPDHYLIAVRREDSGAGGSLWMHTQVRAGATLRIAAPVNAFALDAATADAVLIAGGIGITPIASMAATLAARDCRYTLHYTGRSIAQLAFVDALRALAGEHLHLYGDDEASEAKRFDLARLFATLTPGQPLYVCGPQGLIDAVIALAAERGWPRERIRSELFTAAAPHAGDAAFEVELRQSGMTLTVAPAQTILDAMLDAGLDPLYDCKRGECGVCQVGVIEGAVDHRDYCLSEAEKCSGKVMHICVSRARAGRLIIDA